MVKCIARLIKNGNSLTVAVTKMARTMGLSEGDYVQVVLIPITVSEEAIQTSTPVEDKTVRPNKQEPQSKPVELVKHITFEAEPAPEPEVPIRVKSERVPFDPSMIGNLIIKTANSFDEDSLMKAIESYGVTSDQGQAILEYIQEAVKNDTE